MAVVSVGTEKTYDITIEPGLLLTPQKIVDQGIAVATQFVIIADEHVLALYAEPLQKCFIDRGLTCYTLPFVASEENKTREQKYRIENEMLALGCQRDTCVIAIGGGVTTDIAGYIAATYCRGVPAIYIPTSLLAMVDASVGGKTGVNTEFGKNLIGCFKQPAAVFIDPLVLNSLPFDIFLDGMAEVIKHALLADVSLVEMLSQHAHDILNQDSELLLHIIERNCEIKRDVVAQDETEKGLRKTLNLGHTFAHALEKVSGYGISHGQAVAWGLLFEARLAVALNIADEALPHKIQSLLNKYRLLNARIDLNKDKIIQALKLDKKNQQQQIHFVMLENIAKVYAPNNMYSVAVAQEAIAEVLADNLADILV